MQLENLDSSNNEEDFYKLRHANTQHFKTEKLNSIFKSSIKPNNIEGKLVSNFDNKPSENTNSNISNNLLTES